MKTLVVYESMYGNTRQIAERIGEGIATRSEVKVVPVAHATRELIDWADSLVVGGPTHAHGVSRPRTRAGAADGLNKPDSKLVLEPGYDGAGVREWLAALPNGHGRGGAAFDTRIKGPALFTGRASFGIAHELRRHGFELLTEPESFLVTTQTELVEGELARAWEWGVELVGGVVAVA
jgi:hypothetical protein